MESIKEAASRYGGHFGGSLFDFPGLLEVESEESVLRMRVIEPGDGLGLDLTGFRARLVRNDAPFCITDEPIPASDEFRAVSYLYEEGYAAAQVESGGGGLFLETHSFSQTITPIDTDCGGFVTIGRWRERGERGCGLLDLIALRIPFGFTLIVERDCVHGDATLRGMFAMAMTSNHLTMRTADTVFLKHKATARNISISTDDAGRERREVAKEVRARRPIFYFSGDAQGLAEFKRQTAGQSKIFNPFSKGFWKAMF